MTHSFPTLRSFDLTSVYFRQSQSDAEQDPRPFAVMVWNGIRWEQAQRPGSVGMPPDAPPGSCRLTGHPRAQIGRAHVCTPVTNAHPVCRLLPEKKKTQVNTQIN